MRMHLFAGLLAILAQATSASAWGLTGHRVVGAIAEQHLSASTRLRVRQILGTEDLAEASNWPDFMRSSPEPFWQRTANPWHYVTVPVGQHYSDVGAPPEGDAVTALARFSATLRDPDASAADKRLALRFVIHLVGDLHQPLHVGKPGDRGGNDVKVTFFGESTNLHSVWDTRLIDDQKLSYSEWTTWLSRRITRVQLRRWSDPDPLTWIAESAAVRDRIYPTEIALSYGYVFHNKAVVEEQLEKGGVRLAAYLNALFASPEARPASRGRS